ncbi:unnamed protein product [Bursaphelenchus xylophilus]|uniref:(pine wood nematode) hypothetical protein n=1 Tax=Bursaphelenchus xylophilus TaxID=6326 RepID=A0A7I8X5W3_BURXY|nr:unnamed protein product [Bursaphelenchus xylophilus]CAG9122824.1 unnamed protein product [Bursaphelenchus xylophilus]
MLIARAGSPRRSHWLDSGEKGQCKSRRLTPLQTLKVLRFGKPVTATIRELHPRLEAVCPEGKNRLSIQEIIGFAYLGSAEISIRPEGKTSASDALQKHTVSLSGRCCCVFMFRSSGFHSFISG